MSPSGDLGRFMADYRAMTSETPRWNERIWDDRQVCTDVERDDHEGTIYLGAIYSDARRGGNASAVLRALCELADRHGITLQLTPVRLSRRGLTKRALVAWYSRHGFAPTSKYSMRRLPRSTA